MQARSQNQFNNVAKNYRSELHNRSTVNMVHYMLEHHPER